MTDPVRVGVVGLGYWGPNLARNFDRLPGAELRWICDTSGEARERWSGELRGARASADVDELLADPDLDALVVATDVPSHASLAMRALDAGKHCFVEKPLAQDAASAERLTQLADQGDRVLMVGHLLCYHPGVRALSDPPRLQSTLAPLQSGVAMGMGSGQHAVPDLAAEPRRGGDRR